VIVIIDAHAHVFRQVHGHRTPRSAQEYLAQMDGSGVQGGVLVQPSFLGTDHSEIIEAHAFAPDRFRAVGVADESFTRDDMLRLHASGVRGLRFNFFKGSKVDLTAPAWRRVIELVEPQGWHLELNIPDPGWPQIMAQVAGLTIPMTIDHLGRPDPELRATGPGFRALMAAAAKQTIYAKTTAPFRITMRAQRECLAAWVGANGAHRVLWGSDAPWVDVKDPPAYADTLTWLDDAGLSAADKAAILGLNSRTLFGFP
jgi:predicted TIM-barrel fold metal-dependent hydrolase